MSILSMVYPRQKNTSQIGANIANMAINIQASSSNSKYNGKDMCMEQDSIVR